MAKIVTYSVGSHSVLTVYMGVVLMAELPPRGTEEKAAGDTVIKVCMLC
jgi:hypothetical protein